MRWKEHEARREEQRSGKPRPSLRTGHALRGARAGAAIGKNGGQLSAQDAEGAIADPRFLGLRSPRESARHSFARGVNHRLAAAAAHD
jgi:hypothetical protein